MSADLIVNGPVRLRDLACSVVLARGDEELAKARTGCLLSKHWDESGCLRARVGMEVDDENGLEDENDLKRELLGPCRKGNLEKVFMA